MGVFLKFAFSDFKAVLKNHHFTPIPSFLDYFILNLHNIVNFRHTSFTHTHTHTHTHTQFHTRGC